MATPTPGPAPAASPGPPVEAPPADATASLAAYRTMMAQWFIVQATSGSDKTVVIRLRGELDVTVRATLEELLALLPGARPGRLVIDLADVSFMDCGTAAVVFAAAREALPHGRKPVIRGARPSVRRLLQITGWDKQCAIGTYPRRGQQKPARLTAPTGHLRPSGISKRLRLSRRTRRRGIRSQ